MKKHILPLLVACLLFACKTNQSDVRLTNLTCEYVINPVGIDHPAPLLGWQMFSVENGAAQTAYRILVAESPEALEKNTGDVWDSGEVCSEKSQNISYRGNPLVSGQYYWWKVQIRDQHGKLTEWSSPASWLTGLLSESDRQGEWISQRYADVSPERGFIDSWKKPGSYKATDTSAVYLRKNFDVAESIKKAVVFVSGLGYYELYINGKKVGDHVMAPTFTDYQRQVNYATYDVTSFAEKGKNALGVILGNGFYNSPTEDLFQMEKARWKTPPKLWLQLAIEYADGRKETIITDNTWTCGSGEIVFNSIRAGETIDKRQLQTGWNLASFDDSGWKKAVTVPAPIGRLRAEYMPPMKVTQSIRPENITEPQKGVYLVDFGKNITGWISLKVTGSKGQRIQCDHNEALNDDGTLNTKYSTTHTGGRFQREIFILTGEGEEFFEPRFTYHGFRYVQIRGLKDKPSPDDITAKSVHTALDTIGRFTCSDEPFNNMQQAIQRTLMNSIHGMPAEEPTREKMGWTLDAGDAMEAYLYNFDAINAYKKSLQDFMDAQEPSGHIAAIVPTNGWSYALPSGKPIYWDDPWWGGSIFIIADGLFRFTGDTAVIAHAFDALKGYVDFLTTTAKNDTLDWSLGDWLDLTHGSKGVGPGLTPVTQTSTAGYWWMNERVSAYARMLGKNALADEYAKNAQRIKYNFNRVFLDETTGWYYEGSQTAQALPLFLGMVPENMKAKVEEKLIEAVERFDDHISAGFIGTNPLLNYLASNGQADRAFRIVGQKDTPGWLHMVRDAKSTMGENLNAKGYGSGHHPYGSCVGFFLFKYMGGIRPDETQPGFKNFIIEPLFVPEMENISVKTASLYGTTESSWKRENDRIKLRIVIPGNTTAELLLSEAFFTKGIKGDGKKLAEKATDKPFGKKGLMLRSGTYEFELIP